MLCGGVGSSVLLVGDADGQEPDFSPSGYGIHWPLLDEDLAVGPLVAG